MEIELVNHASVIFSHNDVNLICDPWLDGTVFDQGWSLLAPSKFQYQDFERINYIWFSHEHPDHFFPPNIKKIDEKYRKNITVLYQKTNDKKVVEYLRGLNFKNVIELEANKWCELGTDFKVLCNSFSHDSWLCLRQGDITILNTNDCVINTIEAAEEIHKVIGDISILLTQFSYGQFEGNIDEPKKRKLAVERKFAQMDNQISVFKPRTLIPMASFVYFCHEENYYMNDEINKVGDVYDYYKKGSIVEPVVLYLGDSWKIDEKYENSITAIENWNKEYEKVKNSPNLIRSETIQLEELIKTAIVCVNNFKDKPKLFKQLCKLDSLRVYLSDLQLIVELSYKGLEVRKELAFDIQVSSEVLNYCMKFGWGFNTTHVNGRIQFSKDGMIQFLKYESLSNMLNHDIEMPSISTRAIAKMKRILKKVITK